MAESSKAIIDRAGDNINILYISVANNLSVDCDCVAHPAPVQMADIGIFASLDPVALDRACVDAVHNSPDHGKIHMEQRIAERNGMHLLDYAESLGIGTKKYVLITIYYLRFFFNIFDVAKHPFRNRLFRNCCQYVRPKCQRGTVTPLPNSMSSLTTIPFSASFSCRKPLFRPPTSKV